MPIDPQVEKAVFDGLFWLGALLAALIGGVLLMYLRRRSGRTRADGARGFALEDLRRLRDTGELSISEYEALRRKTIEDLAGTVGRQEE
jgi:hypothetical protein